MLFWPSPSGVPLWAQERRMQGLEARVCVLPPRRPRYESSVSGLVRVRQLKCPPGSMERKGRGVGEAWFIASPGPFAPGGRERLGCACVILSLPMCSGTRADRQASWWACALRRRDLSLRVCVHAPPFPADVAAFLAKARPCSAGAVTSRVRACVFSRRSLLSLGGVPSACALAPPLHFTCQRVPMCACARIVLRRGCPPPLSLVAVRGS